MEAKVTDYPDFTDHAILKSDSEVIAALDKARAGILAYPNSKLNYLTLLLLERIIFSCKVIKYNRFGMKQERHLLLTNLFLCNLKKKCNYSFYFKSSIFLLVLL